MENKNESEISSSIRVKMQIEKFNSYKNEIEKILLKIENEKEINIFYASEIGSRGLGIDVEDSDFDIIGFFIPQNELEYFKIIKKYDRTIKVTQDKKIINDRLYEVDIELYDIKIWLGLKVTKNLTGCDFWFESPLLYRNKYPDIIQEIRKYIIPPSLLYWGKAKSGIGYNEKDIKTKGECLNKSLMNVLSSLFQYLHYQIYLNFPVFNILDEIDFLKEKKQEIINKEAFTEKEFEIIEGCIQVYYKLLDQKKNNGRKSISKEIPNCIYDFKKLLEKNYDTNKRKYEFEKLINEEVAQGWFDSLLKRK